MQFEDFDKKFPNITLEDLKRDYNACDELLEAEYARGEAERQICLVELYRTNSRPLRERIQQDLERARAKLDVLEKYQRMWEDNCSTKPDSKPAREAADDNLASLVQAHKQSKPKSKKTPKAKRSAKKPGKK